MIHLTRIAFTCFLLSLNTTSVTEYERCVSLEFDGANRLVALGIYSRDPQSIPSRLDLTELERLSMVGNDFSLPHMDEFQVDIADFIRDERLKDLKVVTLLNFQLDVPRLDSQGPIRTEILELACKDILSLENCLSYFSPECLKQLSVEMIEWDKCDFKFLSQFPKLESITIRSYGKDTTLNGSRFFDNLEPSRVKSLHFSRFVIAHEDVARLKSVKLLQSLGFKWCDIPPSTNQILSELDSLESLSIMYCKTDGETNPASHSTPIAFKKLTKLEIGIGEEPYPISGIRTPEIHRLEVSGAVDLDMLSALGLGQLRSLSMDRIPIIRDEQLSKMFRTCGARLESIELSYGSISLASFQELSGLPNLDSLRLSHFSIYEDELVFPHDSNISHLELINLGTRPSNAELSKLTKLRSLKAAAGGKKSYLPIEGLEVLSLSGLDLCDIPFDSFDGLMDLSISECVLPEFGEQHRVPATLKRLSLELKYPRDSLPKSAPLNSAVREVILMLASSGYSVRVKTQTVFEVN